MSGGAWPLLVGELICLPDRDNERDLRELIVCGPTSGVPVLVPQRTVQLLIRAVYDSSTIKVVDSRSVMLLDVLGCTRTTLIRKTGLLTSCYLL